MHSTLSPSTWNMRSSVEREGSLRADEVGRPLGFSSGVGPSGSRRGTLPPELRNESKEADVGVDCQEPPLLVDHVGLLANISDGGAIE